MNVVILYIIDRQSGKLLYQDTGNPTHVFKDIADNEDFTLEQPPINEPQKRYWYNNQWNDKPSN